MAKIRESMAAWSSTVENLLDSEECVVSFDVDRASRRRGERIEITQGRAGEAFQNLETSLAVSREF
jgi:hypothetical protein